jgi:hypothetical protein
MDSYLNKPLDSYIDIDDQAIISLEPHENLYTMGALIFRSKHLILENLIEIICDNIEQRKYLHSIHRTTGPSAYSLAINETHKQLFGEDLNWKHFNEKGRSAHAIYRKNGTSYRIYGVSYNSEIALFHNKIDILYKSELHWTKEQRTKPVIKN